MQAIPSLEAEAAHSGLSRPAAAAVLHMAGTAAARAHQNRTEPLRCHAASSAPPSLPQSDDATCYTSALLLAAHANLPWCPTPTGA